MSPANAPMISRYLVSHDWNGGNGPRVLSSFRTRDEADAKAREDKARWPHLRVTVSGFALQPNQKIVEFGVERFDRMLVGVHTDSITLLAPLDELIECGAIGSYVREILGKSGGKASCDEYGNYYRLSKRAKHRHELVLHFDEEAQIPDGNALRPLGITGRDPLKTDISGILGRITKRKGSAA